MNLFKKIEIVEIIILIFLGYLSWLVFFKGLGDYSLRVWDEGRNAVNSLEMAKNHNYLVSYFDGKPEMWNTKPPFLFWLVNLSYGIFGENEFAVRFPSALSATGVVFLVYFWTKKRLKTKAGAFLSSLILLSAMGFSDWHIGRTGDFDALLTFLIFGFVILFFEYLEDFDNKKNIFASFLFLTGAVLTKGIAGLFMIVGVFIYLCIFKKIKIVLSDKYFWMAFFVFFSIVFSYYFLRELFNNGYLKAVWDNEILRAVDLKSVEKSGISYYWKYLNEYRFSKWILFVPISFLSIWLTKDKVIKRWILLLYLIFMTYFSLISLASTKYLWYDAPLYPFMSILVGSFITLVIKRSPLFFKFFLFFFLLYYLQRFLRTNIAYVSRPDLEKENSCIKYGYFFRNNTLDKKVFGVHDDFCTPFDFYLLRNGNKRKKIDELKIDDNIFSCDGRTLNLVNQGFELVTTLETPEGCFEGKILDYKN